MNKLDTQIVEFIEAGKSKEDCVTFLVMTNSYETKTLARDFVEQIIEENDLVTTKITKSDLLKEWFLKLENPLEITKEEIQAKCKELEMKGGSVQYYVNAYRLAIDLTKQVK